MTDSRKFPWFWTVLFAIAAIAGGAWGYQQHRLLADFDFTKRRQTLLESENTRLQTALTQAEKESSRAYEISERKPIEEAVQQIRGLHFQHPVIYDVLTREGIKKVVEQKLDEQFSEQDFKDIATGYAALGLLEPGYPLKQKYIDLLGEQIAAFYDQHQHKLFMFEDASLHSTQNRIVLAHELTHALQDQNFGLLKLPLEIKTNDDMALATSALIEGDATVVMSDFMMKNFTLKALRENLSGALTQNMSQLKNAPPFLREMLMFPYMRGQEFCNAVREQGGYAAISEVYKNPPTSSTQILHPEKYFAREEPIRIEWPDTSLPGRKPIVDNVLGEMGIRILLSQWGDSGNAARNASGWRGDRYLVFRGPAGSELVWKTIWSDPGDASRFSDALEAALMKRYNLAAASLTRGTPFKTELIKKKNGVILVSQAGNRVVLIDTTDEAWQKLLNDKFTPDGQN